MIKYLPSKRKSSHVKQQPNQLVIHVRHKLWIPFYKTTATAQIDWSLEYLTIFLWMRTKDLCWQRGQILYPQHPPRMNSLLKKILRNFSAAYTLKRFSLRTHPELRPVVMPQVKSRMTIFHTAVMVFPLVLMVTLLTKLTNQADPMMIFSNP